MAEFTLSGQMKVKTLKVQFKEKFGATLRVYKNISCNGPMADDDDTLASVRAEGFKGGEFEVRGNMLVGNFEKKVAELYGIGVQVATPDDSKLSDNYITLATAGRNQKNEIAVKEIEDVEDDEEDLEDDDEFEDGDGDCEFCENVECGDVEYSVCDGEALAAFLLNDEIDSLVIPETIEDEDGNKFTVTEFDIENLENVKHLTLPKTLKRVYGCAFSDTDLDGLTVKFAGTPTLVYEDGIFYTAGKQILCNTQMAQIGSEFTVPEGVEEIEYDAFLNASELVKLNLPSTIRTIYPAFGSCDQLAEVYVKAAKKDVTLVKEDRDQEPVEVFSETAVITYETDKEPLAPPQAESSENPLKKWIYIENKLESTVITFIEKYVNFFSNNKVIGYLSFLTIFGALFGLIAYLSMFYYGIKFVVRIVMLVQKCYEPTPDNEKGTLFPVLRSIWKEYGEWASTNKVMGFLGYLYLWLYIVCIMVPVVMVYIPYTIIRIIFDGIAKK